MDTTPIVPYLSEPLSGRVLFGPFPKSPAEIHHLLDTRGVNCIINLKALTDERTKSGLPRDSWYSCFWSRNTNPPDVLRFPLPKKDSKRRDLVAWYVKGAQRAATEGGPDAIYYVHHETGLQEEALFAFVLCQVLQPGCIPDVDAWIAAHPNAQGVLLGDDERAFHGECMAQLKATGSQPMLKWITVTKRQKLEGGVKK